MDRTYPSYYIYRDNKGLWRWSYAASNGRTIAISSESYYNKVDCQRGIDIMKSSNFTSVWTPTTDAYAA